jgi:hypothetical protein
MKCGWGRRQYLRELKNITTALFLERANAGGFEKWVKYSLLLPKSSKRSTGIRPCSSTTLKVCARVPSDILLWLRNRLLPSQFVSIHETISIPRCSVPELHSKGTRFVSQSATEYSDWNFRSSFPRKRREIGHLILLTNVIKLQATTIVKSDSCSWYSSNN